ncbi:transposase [Streptomyces sp. NPDC002730]|uniref:transposase n=1 Tax=Streptomyces sp. NPDC002730 TaxID=3364662 RepID=UPI0036C5048E
MIDSCPNPADLLDRAVSRLTTRHWKYPLELRERAVRMYRTTEPKPQIKRLAIELGVHPEALRGWIGQAEPDAGEHDHRHTTGERAELAAPRKENARLKRANEVGF